MLVVVTAILAFILPFAASPAYAAPYSLEIDNFTVSYDVHADRTINVEEKVAINYTGTHNTGFLRDLPVNAGDRVYNVEVKELSGNTEKDVDYKVSLESDLMTLDIGDTTVKSGIYTYIIRYEYAVTKPTDPNALFLNIVGFGSEAPINESHVTIHLPEGFERADLYVGDTSTPSQNYDYDEATNTITVDLSSLKAFNGATMDLFFAEGVLSTRFDYTPIILAVVGLVVLAVLAGVKFFVFPRKPLTPVVNFEPPRGMDPVEISKLIDNKVDSGDVTSLIFYWASKGYLKIDLTDKDDPALIRIHTTLPEGAPEHQIVMYNALFSAGDMVKVSQLEGKFYSVIDSVKGLVNERHSGLYTSRSVIASLAFTLVGGLMMALAPIFAALAGINISLFFYPAFIALIPAYIIYAVSETYAYSVHKLTKGKKGLMIAGIVALIAIFTAIYTILIPSQIIEVASKIVICIMAYAVVALAPSLISPTKQYTEDLNQILGFKNFILYTEKDKLEVMIKEDPEFYYKILPYAQVMGVSDVWEDKFKDLTVKPPEWVVDPTGSIVTFAVINSAIRSTSYTFRSKMTVRPSSPSSRSFSGGGRHGGSFGGRGGGGHGGGGFRGR